MAARTYYDTLQVSRFASASVIRAAYKALSQKHHPDKNPDDIDAAHMNMKRLNEAYEVLSDPRRKATYDELVASLERDKARPSEAKPVWQTYRDAEGEDLAARSRQNGTTSDRDFNGHRRHDSETSGQRGYFDGAKPKTSGYRTVLFVAFLLGLAGIVAFNNLKKPTPQAAMHNPVGASPTVVASTPASRSNYPRCAGSYERAKCERLEESLTAEGFAASKERAKKLDAERARNMQAVNSGVAQAPAPVQPAPVAMPVAAAAKVPVQPSPAAIAAVAPFVRQRDYSCQSTVTLNLNSTNYSGLIEAELRAGSRPGSQIYDRATVYSAGVIRIDNVCLGIYFFAFATPDSESVSTTRYFTVEGDLQGYSNPEITVTYSHSVAAEGQRVGYAPRNAL